MRTATGVNTGHAPPVIEMLPAHQRRQRGGGHEEQLADQATQRAAVDVRTVGGKKPGFGRGSATPSARTRGCTGRTRGWTAAPDARWPPRRIPPEAPAPSRPRIAARPTLISPRWRSTAARRNSMPGAIACSSHQQAGPGRPSSRSGVNGAGSIVGAVSRRQSMRNGPGSAAGASTAVVIPVTASSLPERVRRRRRPAAPADQDGTPLPRRPRPAQHGLACAASIAGSLGASVSPWIPSTTSGPRVRPAPRPRRPARSARKLGFVEVLLVLHRGGADAVDVVEEQLGVAQPTRAGFGTDGGSKPPLRVLHRSQVRDQQQEPQEKNHPSDHPAGRPRRSQLTICPQRAGDERGHAWPGPLRHAAQPIAQLRPTMLPTRPRSSGADGDTPRPRPGSPNAAPVDRGRSASGR